MPHSSRASERACAALRLALLPLPLLTACDVFDGQLERKIVSEVSSDASAASAQCELHSECGDAGALTACVLPAGRCVAVETPECKLVEGELSDGTIVIGAIFATSGPTAATNIARRNSAVLAVKEINAVGGVPGPGSSARKLALLACDAAQNVMRGARHLVEELAVPAIVGPNTSQDTIDVSREISVPGGTLLLTPTAVASSIADLSDDDLTWLMVPNDEQRATLMKLQIGELERMLREERGRAQVKLSVIYRDDALGQGTRVGLNSLELNDKTLVENGAARPPSAVLEPYDPKLASQTELVARQVQFAPDIVVLGGTAEAIEEIMVPLERDFRGSSRPHYILIDSLRGPELLRAIGDNDDLRRRVRGTGIVPTERSQEVYDAFRIAYQTSFPGESATLTGMAPSYDAVHAIAYALAATREQPPTGESIARGLRMLSGGSLEVPVQSTKILSAFHELSAGKRISALGSFGPLAWDERGAVKGGSVEVWCVRGGAQPTYGSSGLTFDLEGMTTRGSFRPCAD